MRGPSLLAILAALLPLAFGLWLLPAQGQPPATPSPQTCEERLQIVGRYASHLKDTRDQYELALSQLQTKIADLEQRLAAKDKPKEGDKEAPKKP